MAAKFGLGVLLLLVGPALFVSSSPDTVWISAGENSSGPSDPIGMLSGHAPARPGKGQVLTSVRLDSSLSMTTFDRIMEATFTVNNGSALDIQDLEIECVHRAFGGTKIDTSSRTIAEVVEAGGIRTFPKFSMGPVPPKVETIACGIRDLALR